MKSIDRSHDLVGKADFAREAVCERGNQKSITNNNYRSASLAQICEINRQITSGINNQ